MAFFGPKSRKKPLKTISGARGILPAAAYLPLDV
jgi:hypothetical protein